MIDTGKGLPYLPGAASLAATHKGRIGNIRTTALRDTKDERNPGVVILTFEDECLKYDKQNEVQLGYTGMQCIILFLAQFYYELKCNHRTHERVFRAGS